MNNASPNDPRHLWQAQETEKMTIQPQQIPEKIQRLHKRGRVTNAFLAAVFGLIGIYYAFQVGEAPDLLRAIGCALISLGNFYWTYLAVTAIRSSRLPVLAPDEPLRTSVQFYRQILEETFQGVRGGNRRAMRGAVAIVIGVAILIIQPKESVQNATAEVALKAFVQNLGVPLWLIAWLPFLVIVASWAALRCYGRIVSTKWITHEIERVDQMS